MWRRNGLSIVLFLLLACFLVGQVWTGFLSHNQELHEAHRAGLDLWAYLHSGHFVSATFENWESEFLQMGKYVLITVRLRQKGSAESRPLKGEEEEERILPGPPPGQSGKAVSGSSSTVTRWPSSFPSFSSGASSCIWPGAGAQRWMSRSPGACPPLPAGGTCGAAASGLNPFRTGRASFWRSSRW
jgi:hypothetical protein